MTAIIHILWHKITEIMDHSIFFRFINGTMEFIKALFSGSILARLGTEMKESELRKSFFVRYIQGVFAWVARIRDAFFAEAFDNSVLVGLIKQIPVYIAGLSLKDIGMGLTFGAITLTGLNQLLTVTHSPIIGRVILCVGVLLLFIGLRTPDLLVKSLLSGSLLVSMLPKCISLSAPMPKRSGHIGTVACVLLGIILGSLFYFLPFTYFLLAAAGIPAVLIIAAFPEIGIMAVIGAVPFLPTMVLAAMLGFITLCFFLKLLTDRNYSFMIDITGVFLILYIIIYLFLGFTSFARGSSIKIALLTTLFMFSYFLTVMLIRKKEQFDLTVFIFSLSAALTGVYGLYQKFSGRIDMTWVDKELFEGLKLRVFSTFGNPNVYGAYLLLAAPICVCMVLYAKHWLAKMYYLGVSALLFLNLALTYSRGCYVAIAVAAVVFVLFMEQRLIAFLSLGIVALPFALPPSIINRIASITNFSDSSTSYRISIWQATLRIIRDYWFVGLGQGIDAYNKVYPLYRFNSVSAPHSHNLYLQIFVETGILGLGIFVALILCFYKTQIPFFRQSKGIGTRSLTAGFMAVIIAFLLQGVFDYVFYNNRLHLAFFIVLGLGNAFVGIMRREEPR